MIYFRLLRSRSKKQNNNFIAKTSKFRMKNTFVQISNKFIDFLGTKNAHFYKEKHKMSCLSRFDLLLVILCRQFFCDCRKIGPRPK